MGGFQFPGPTFGISEGSVFFLRIMPGRVRTNELVREPDLDDVSHHPHLHLLKRERIARPIAGAGEADVASTVHLADDRPACGPWARPRPARSHSKEGRFCLGRLAAGTVGNEVSDLGCTGPGIRRRAIVRCGLNGRFSRVITPAVSNPPITRGRAPYAIESVCLCKSELSRGETRYSVLPPAVFDEKSGWTV